MICAIAGASGLVGAELLTVLLGEERYSKVIALVRRPLEREHPKLSLLVTDFDRPSYGAELAGVSDVFCCLGTTLRTAGSKEAFQRVDRDYPVELARAAHAAGCAQFLIVTAVGANPKSAMFYNRTKGEVEAAVGAFSFSGGVKIFRPSMLLGDRKESRPGEALGRAMFSATRGLFRGGLTRYRGIFASELARALFSAAREHSPGVHRYEGKTLFSLTV